MTKICIMTLILFVSTLGLDGKLYDPTYIEAHGRFLKKDNKKKTQKSEKETVNVAASNSSCDPDWKEKREVFRHNRYEVWQDPSCYTFTFERYCKCLNRGPFHIEVQNGIASANTTVDVSGLTMRALFKEVRLSCFKDCPSSGADECNLEYGEAGNLENVRIDRIKDAFDDENTYVVRNFTIC